MTTMIPTLEELPREQLLTMAHEYMLSGMIVTRAMMPLVVMQSGDMDLMNQVAIDEWMGASPVYTARMRGLMGIDGDDVGAIMKALQLDVGFVHQYMDVAYKLIDDHHAEFWLAHCGALLDAEPHGEERVFGMCHTIEDPTFDATALATNPRARIRPIHRPPRTPADRHPHCHWTITIDPANDPVPPIALTNQVARLPLASVPNELVHTRAHEGMDDYRRRFDPSFRLTGLSDAALVAVAREFQMQSHLLMAATHLALPGNFDATQTSTIMRDAWLGAGWIVSERLVRALGISDAGSEELARVLSLTPIFPPGFDRRITVDGDRVGLELVPTHSGVFDAGHAGWCGALARGEAAGIEGAVRGVTRSGRIDEIIVGTDSVRCDIVIDRTTAVGPEPDVLALNRIGSVAGWSFANH
jgi:hypothetical protein